jgi:hypothetical protein
MRGRRGMALLMSVQLEKLTGPLIVAGIIALVGFAWKISLQVETINGEVNGVKAEVKQNRQVTCAFAKKVDVVIGDCPL